MRKLTTQQAYNRGYSAGFRARNTKCNPMNHYPDERVLGDSRVEEWQIGYNDARAGRPSRNLYSELP